MRMLTLALLLLCGDAARGEWLVDGPWGRDAFNAHTFTDDMLPAVQFAVTQDTVIDSIEGRLFVYNDSTDVSPEDGNVRWSIFSNGDDNFPSQPLLSKNFYANESPVGMRVDDWYGIRDPGWTLTPGTYWAVLQPAEGVYATGGILRTTNARMEPQYYFASYYAVDTPVDYRWMPSIAGDTSNIGIRIAGHAVPEPSGLTLAALAVAVVALRRKAPEGRA